MFVSQKVRPFQKPIAGEDQFTALNCRPGQRRVIPHAQREKSTACLPAKTR
jgi:hypothetical protein